MSGRLPRVALVLGLARSGQAAVAALSQRGAKVIALDRDETIDAGRLERPDVEIHLGAGASPALLDGVEVVVKSPGIPNEAPMVTAARARGVTVWSEVELGYRLLDEQPIIGVTGTNGKTTTSELIGAMFREADLPCRVAGNVGWPLSGVADGLEPDAWVVCELSSFQLEGIDQFSARVGVLLNIAADHLDRHASLAEYEAAKLRVFERQQPSDDAVVPRGFGAIPGQGRRHEFDAHDSLPAEPAIPGAHNRENAAAATTAARAAGVPDDAIAAALVSFEGVPHRLERVARVGGVQFVNDSKATNPASSEHGIRAYPGCLLIMGGSRKGTPFDGVARVAAECGVKRVYLVGEAAPDIAAALKTVSVEYCSAGTLDVALRCAFERARDGDVVLLSPACASYDQFADFEDRGDEFRRLVAAL